jgi:hypothetical protein
MTQLRLHAWRLIILLSKTLVHALKPQWRGLMIMKLSICLSLHLEKVIHRTIRFNVYQKIQIQITYSRPRWRARRIPSSTLFSLIEYLQISLEKMTWCSLALVTICQVLVVNILKLRVQAWSWNNKKIVWVRFI